MELKLKKNIREYKVDGLLIVPYGIETYKYVKYDSFGGLLIVPYGIETFFCFLINRAIGNF